MGQSVGYDAVRRHLTLERLVTKRVDGQPVKKYYRFRADRWYGGIATADCVGCGLLCRFCWVRDDALYRPDRVGEFYAPREVVARLTAIAARRRYRQLRVSGGEPTIGREHLVGLLEALEGRGVRFILETNGILLGHLRDYALALSPYPFLHVRVSLKGCNEEEFARLTGARSEGYRLQLQALANLVDAGVACHPAVMVSFSSPEGLRRLLQILQRIDARLATEIEVEELILYPQVVTRLARFGVKYERGHPPSRVPAELV